MCFIYIELISLECIHKYVDSVPIGNRLDAKQCKSY